MFIIHNCKNIFIFMFIMHNMYLTDQIPKYLNLKRNEPAEVDIVYKNTLWIWYNTEVCVVYQMVCYNAPTPKSTSYQPCKNAHQKHKTGPPVIHTRATLTYTVLVSGWSEVWRQHFFRMIFARSLPVIFHFEPKPHPSLHIIHSTDDY